MPISKPLEVIALEWMCSIESFSLQGVGCAYDGFHSCHCLCDKSEGPQSVDFELIKSEMIPGYSPYKGSEISRGKEIFSSAGFEDANNHDVREHRDRTRERMASKCWKKTLTKSQ